MELPYKMILPWPPSINTLYFQGKSHGQKFLSKKGREYKKMIHNLYASDDNTPTDLPLKVRIELFPPDKRDRDIDNYVKAILDGLKDLNLIVDDSQVAVLAVIKHEKLDDLNQGLAIVYVKHYTAVNRALDRLPIIREWMTKLGFGEDELILFHKPKKKYIKKADRPKEETE